MKVSVIPALFLMVLIAHQFVFVNHADARDGYALAQCVECHEEMVDDHALSVHGSVECLGCHTEAAEEEHEALAPVDCRKCHAPHDEKVIHDAHTRVTCKACHLEGGELSADPESGSVIWNGMFRPGSVLPPHQSVLSETGARCGNCHFQGNIFGASSMILPAKGFLCLTCHVATFSVSDKITFVSLCIFLAGMVGLGVVWFSGTMGNRAYRAGEKTEMSTRFEPAAFFYVKRFRLLKVLLLEVFLLQRLFRLSPVRWFIHALIFFPFFFRFAFGLTALLLSIFLPGGSLTTAMLDKNHAVCALFFDVTGLMVLAGSAAAIFRLGNDPAEMVASLPKPGRGMSAMIGLIVLVGFILEGLRIAMTGWPDGARWAFLGYAISLSLKGMTGLTDSYGYVWYAHAILTGIFIALIPFTRMIHIITAPIVLIINARRGHPEIIKNEV